MTHPYFPGSMHSGGPPPPLVAVVRSLQSTQVCNPDIEFCKFNTTFSVDFGEHGDILKDGRAQSIFGYFTTRWINACRDRDANEMFFGFYFDGDGTTKTTNYDFGRRTDRIRSIGQSNGKCKGNECPKPVTFSLPFRRLQACGGVQLLEDLTVYPDFYSLSQLLAGDLVISNIDVNYDFLDECEDGDDTCVWTTQRNAAQAFLLGLNLSNVIDDLQHECHWEGIGCNQERNISSIFLRQKELSGTIASELGLLTEIEHIDIADNLIYGTIPSELGELQNVKSLFLNDNELIGTIPSELGSLENLNENFTIGGNSVTGDMSFFCPQDYIGLGCFGPSTNFPTQTPTGRSFIFIMPSIQFFSMGALISMVFYILVSIIF